MFKKNKLPIILQSELAECGLASLAMILSYYGSTLSLSQLRRKFQSSSLKGITLVKLKEIAQRLNLDMTVLRLELNQLKKVQLPCILHWDMNHFLVLREISNEKMIVHDPARGFRKISFDEANHSFTGIALEVKPNTNFKPLASEKDSSQALMFRLLKLYGKSITKLVFSSIIIQLCYISSIKLIQRIIDSASVPFNGEQTFIWFLILAFLGSKLMEVCSISLRLLMVTSIGTNLNHDFGSAVMKHLLSLPSSFFENRYVGDVLSRFNGIEKIRTTLTEGLAEGLVDGLISIITFAVLALYSAKMAFIVALTSFVYFLSRVYYNTKAREHQEEALHAKSSELSNFMETIKSIPSIKIFSKDNIRLKSWAECFIRTLNATTNMVRHKIIYDSAKNLLFGIELTINLFIACTSLANKSITLGMLYAFLAYRQQFTTAIGGLVDKVQDYRLLKLHIERLDDVLSEPSELIEQLNSDQCKNFKTIVSRSFERPLCLENISFTYALDTTPVLKDINLKIAPYECIAITGPSGCGKTTLLKIMMGLIPPTSGKVTINGILIYSENIKSYRKWIAAVLQNDVLFSGTIKENISFFDKDLNFEHILNCAKLAGILDEVNNFPMGFDTLIGDMGSVLSGGQKQRILLARALYAKPKILFLDEASSHLDAKKEREVNDSIRSLGITVISIAHRIETIQMADRIIDLATLYSPPEIRSLNRSKMFRNPRGC